MQRVLLVQILFSFPLIVVELLLNYRLPQRSLKKRLSLPLFLSLYQQGGVIPLRHLWQVQPLWAQEREWLLSM